MKGIQMNKQRIFILLLAVIGIISVFLPWVSAPVYGSVNGFDFDTGKLMIAMYAVTVALVLLGDRKSCLAGAWFYSSLLLPFAAGAIALSNIIKINSEMSMHHGSVVVYEIGIGLYMIIIIGLLVPVAGYLLKSKEKPATDITDSENPEIES